MISSKCFGLFQLKAIVELLVASVKAQTGSGFTGKMNVKMVREKIAQETGLTGENFVLNKNAFAQNTS